MNNKNDEKKENELSMEYHLTMLKDSVAPHILKDLELYSKEFNDSPERIILRISEILTNAMHRQFNMYIANLIKFRGYGGNSYYDDGNGEFSVSEFNKDWMNKGLPFDDIAD